MISRVRRQDKSESQSSQVINEGAPKTAKTTQKYGKKKNLIKTQQVPPKARSSLDKGKRQDQSKAKTKAKLNPWRSNNKEPTHTDSSHLQGDRSTGTPQTLSLFNNK